MFIQFLVKKTIFQPQNCAVKIKQLQTPSQPFFVSVSGGLPFELQARRALRDIVLGAVKDVKERLAQNNEKIIS